MENKQKIELIKKVYESKGDISQKIAALIIERRKNHGNYEVQDVCNEYLTKLYDKAAKKYDEMFGGVKNV